MPRRLHDNAPSPHVLTCGRCGLTLPVTCFDRARSTCSDCRGAMPLPERISAVAADYTLRCHAALHLLNLGLTVAAAEVLTSNRGWPTIREARRMQQQQRNVA